MPIDFGKFTDGIDAAIKAAAIYKFGLAVVCGFYWFLLEKNYVPPSPWQQQASAFGFILFSVLWVANIIAMLLDIFRPREWFVHYISVARQRREVERYIPFMGEKERAIIGYLLSHKQKTFIADQDGGHAMTLISRAVVVRALAPGQVFYQDRVPMIIPDHIWKVLERHKAEFPYTAAPDDEVVPDPWRKHFMDR